MYIIHVYLSLLCYISLLCLCMSLSSPLLSLSCASVCISLLLCYLSLVPLYVSLFSSVISLLCLCMYLSSLLSLSCTSVCISLLLCYISLLCLCGISFIVYGTCMCSPPKNIPFPVPSIERPVLFQFHSMIHSFFINNLFVFDLKFVGISRPFRICFIFVPCL